MKRPLIISSAMVLLGILLWPKKSKAASLPPSSDEGYDVSHTVIPGGNILRECDSRGCGYYGASRGSRKHEGVDLVAEAGTTIMSGIVGTVSRHIRVYANDSRYTGIEIKGEGVNEGWTVKYFYVGQLTSVGTKVNQRSTIGKVQNIANKFSGITPHVHIELYIDGKQVDPTPYFT